MQHTEDKRNRRCAAALIILFILMIVLVLLNISIGSYSVPLGEIESVCVDDGHLVILINKGTDVIYRTKDRVGI